MPQQQQQQQQRSLDEKMELGFGYFHLGLEVMTVCFTPFLRSRMGRRGIGTPGFFSAFAIPLIASMLSEPLLIDPYWYAWIVMAIWRRITYDKTEPPGSPGYNWALHWLVGEHDRLAEVICMPLLACFMPTVGMQFFVGVLGTATLGAKLALDNAHHAAEVTAIQDAQREIDRQMGLMNEARKGG